MHTSFRKVTMTFFFDWKSQLLVDFLEHYITINAQRYAETFRKLNLAIKTKRPGKLTDSIILLHDNARPHAANIVTAKLKQFHWNTLTHPPYSPALSECDFYIFVPLKKITCGRRFASKDEVHAWIQSWFRKQPQTFFFESTDHLLSQWDKCINSYGNYFRVNKYVTYLFSTFLVFIWLLLLYIRTHSFPKNSKILCYHYLTGFWGGDLQRVSPVIIFLNRDHFLSTEHHQSSKVTNHRAFKV